MGNDTACHDEIVRVKVRKQQSVLSVWQVVEEIEGCNNNYGKSDEGVIGGQAAVDTPCHDDDMVCWEDMAKG